MSTTLNREIDCEGADPSRIDAGGIHEAFLAMNTNSYYMDYLRFAIRRIQSAAGLYSHAAQSIEGADLRSFFEEMAELKQRAVNHLYDTHKTGCYLLYETNSSPASERVVSYLSGAGLKFVTTMFDACHFTLRNELIDLQVFKNVETVEEDPAVKSLFNIIVQLQKSPIRAINDKLSLLGFEMAGQKYSSVA